MTNTSYVQGPWSLRELFSGLDAPEIQKEIGELEQQVQAFEALRPGLSPTLAERDFAAAVGAYDALLRKLSRLDGFAELSFAENTQDPKVQSLQARMQQLGAETANRTLFFQLWWKALDDAAASRLLPHPPSFTPVAAMALFGGATFTDKRAAFLVPLGGLFLSDLVIGLHALMPVVYGAFALIVGIGFWLRGRRRATRIIAAAVASAVLFFVLGTPKTKPGDYLAVVSALCKILKDPGDRATFLNAQTPEAFIAAVAAAEAKLGL